MKKLFFLLVLFVVLALTAENISAGKTLDRAMVRKSKTRIALVIGNAAYADSPLRNPVNDANTMKRILENLGFDVEMATDANKRKMLATISRFGKRLKHSEIGFFFYAGHGIGINNRNYIIPVDANVEIEADVETEAIDISRVLSRMESAANKLNVVVLDACRNNPFARSFRSSNKGLVKMDAPAGMLIAYATAPGNVASDGKGKNGLYTSCLLQALQQPNVELKEAFNNAGLLVMQKTGDKQVPWMSITPLPPFSFGFFDGQGGETVQPTVPQVVAPPVRPQNTLPATYTDPTTDMELVLVKGGCYQMGDTFGEGWGNEKPVHGVCVDDFYMGKYEVTQGEWKRIMGNNPSYFKKGDNYPVEDVSWNDITEDFLPKLNSRSGKNYRLPTEAEWEYAAHEGGKKVRFGNGKNIADPQEINFRSDKEYKKSYSKAGTYRESTVPVNSFSPNGLGLYNMSGNVYEWCSDTWHSSYAGAPADGSSWESGGGSGRVFRGGSWFSPPGSVRSVRRNKDSPDDHNDGLGFRLVLPVY